MNCDFKKFDETLRMVLDCSKEQISEIHNLLEGFLKQNKISYGIHKSENALITCMVFSATQNKHTHFVDGAGGGYAYASIQFKQGLGK